jgi:Tfp pilus assembly protein PilE
MKNKSTQGMALIEYLIVGVLVMAIVTTVITTIIKPAIEQKANKFSQELNK